MTKAERKKRDKAIERELRSLHASFRLNRVLGLWTSAYQQRAWSCLLNTWVREQTPLHAALAA
jgi:hypothetical protein